MTVLKTAKKIGISGGMLSSAKDAEASLEREEAKGLENGLPEGHPLRNEAEKQKALLGDLSGLPPGHPLIRAMQDAKARYDQQQEQKVNEQANTAEVKKAQKVASDNARVKARRAEEEQSEKILASSKIINSGIDGALDEVRKLYKMMADNEEILNIDPLSRAKVGRLRRLLYASERGLSECKLSKVRA